MYVKWLIILIFRSVFEWEKILKIIFDRILFKYLYIESGKE